MKRSTTGHSGKRALAARPDLAALQLATVALLLAGCTQHTSRTAGSTSQPPATGRPSASASSTDPSAPSTDLACKSNDLALSSRGVVGNASGNYVALFTLKNTGTATCHLVGFPGFTLIGAPNPESVAQHDGGSYIPLPTQPVAVTIQPSASAEFEISGSDFDAVNNRALPNSSTARVYPPGETRSLSVAAVLPMPAHGLQVSPVEPPGCLENSSCVGS